MSDKKKNDLTKIEDLDEFLHQDIEKEDDSSEQSEDFVFNDPIDTADLDDLEFDINENTSKNPFDDQDDPTNPEIEITNPELQKEIPEENEEINEVKNFDIGQEEDFFFNDKVSTANEWSDEPSIESPQAAGPENEEEIKSHLDKEIHQPTGLRAPQESFKDVQNFAENLSIGTITQGGNPPYSILITNIRYKEDAENIYNLLKEHKIIDGHNQEVFRNSIDHGRVLVAQLSEYAAIFLAHKLRRFDIDLEFGLSEEIFASKTYGENPKGLTTKKSLYQNKKEDIQLTDEKFELESIFITTTSHLEGHEIIRYLGIASEHVLMNENDFADLPEYRSLFTQYLDQENEENKLQLVNQEFLKGFSVDQKLEEDQEKVNYDEPSLKDIYTNLAMKLRDQAFKNKGNAVIGVNYQINQIMVKIGNQVYPKYKISCTGNVVIVG